jgi:arylsulfatase A
MVGRGTLSVVVALFVSLVAGSAGAQAPDLRPSFVVVVADDLGWGDLPAFGNPTIQAPNLDRLAAEGMRLTAFYAAAPVCSPSRAGLLTGRAPGRTRVWDWIPEGSDMHLPASEITVARLLRDAGYATAFAGKWHLNGGLDTSQPQPDDHGFEHVFATASMAQPSHRDPYNFVRDGREVGPLAGWACQLVTDDALGWLDGVVKAGRPFFLMVSYHEPHELIASPPELIDLYPSAQNRFEAEYFANVTNLDRAVGRLLDSLEALGVADRTLVVFTSDNGPEMHGRHPQAQRSYGSAGPLRGKKLQLWEGGIRVPTLVRWPGRVAAGSASDRVAGFVDLLPTVCELAGVAVPADRTLDGTSLVRMLTEGVEPVRTTPLFWYHYKAWGGPRAAIRDGRFKLVSYWDGPEVLHTDSSTMRPGDQTLIRSATLVRFELYDLEADPEERRDVSSLYPAEAERPRARLVELVREVAAEGRSDWRESWLRRW